MAISYTPARDVAVAAVAPVKAVRRMPAPSPAGVAVTASVASTVPSAVTDKVTPRCRSASTRKPLALLRKSN